MASPTTFEEIYAVFQSQISDIEFNNLTSFEDLQKFYLINSISNFRRCLQDLNNRDDTASTFNITLLQDETKILGYLMVIEYLSSQIVTNKLLRQSMSTRDFNQTSQAAHLEKLILLKNDRQKDISKMIVDYTYNFGDLSKLK